MPSYSAASKTRLATCDPRLQRVFNAVLALGFDHSILCGERGQQEQHEAFLRGYSKKDYPASEHNKHPSRAVDAQPYPAHVGDRRWQQDCSFFAGVVVGVAASMGIRIRWGGDWDQDRTTTDENGLVDMPHFELED